MGQEFELDPCRYDSLVDVSVSIVLVVFTSELRIERSSLCQGSPKLVSSSTNLSSIYRTHSVS